MAISGVTQLATMDCAWKSLEDESHEDDMSKYQQTLADSLQGSLTAMQQALVDTAWPCSLRVLLPSLLASMLAGSPHGSQIASHPWHLEIARCGYSTLAAKTSRAGILVWLGFMQVMLQFKAEWLEIMLTPDVVERMVQLTRANLDDRKVLSALLEIWKNLPPCIEISDAQRSNLQQTLRRAFQSTAENSQAYVETVETSRDLGIIQENPALTALFIRCHVRTHSVHIGSTKACQCSPNVL